jgi:type 2 lantibiotic biosynthesis protein LanM
MMGCFYQKYFDISYLKILVRATFLVLTMYFCFLIILMRIPMKSTTIQPKSSYLSTDLSTTQKAFLQIADDLIDQYWAKFILQFDSHGYIFIQKELLEKEYFTLLSHKVIHLVARPAVLELNVARQLGELKGQTPEERFDYFFKNLDKKEFWAQYPVLLRQLHTTLHSLNTYLLEIFTHYAVDWKTLFPNHMHPPYITSIDADLLDVYSQGRCVTIIGFDDKVKWVYKPRDSAIDAAFQSFLAWFNSKNELHPFKLLHIVSRETYSWNEFAKQSDAFSAQNIEIVYQKIGTILCFAYLFDTIDLHQGNCMLSENDVFMIDLETLLQPRTAEPTRRSLRNTHLLPTPKKEVTPDQDDLQYAQKNVKVWANKIWTTEKSFCWENEGQDTMQIVRRRLLVNPSDNRLIVDNQLLNPLEYLHCIVKGFRKTYRFIEANKDEFLEKTTACFIGLKIRLIVRGTKKYVALVDEMTHPSILESEAKLDQFLSALNYESDNSEFENTIAEEEKKHLRDMITPSFTTLTNQKGLYTEGGQIISNYFETEALSVVQQNIADMSAQDMNNQIRILRRAFKHI